MDFSQLHREPRILGYLLLDYLNDLPFKFIQILKEDTELLRNEEYFETVMSGFREIFGNLSFLQISYQQSQHKTLETFFLVLFLFQVLPQFDTKVIVEFNGNLLENVQKSIQISNPSTRHILYNPLLYGSKDFKLETEDIQVGPKSETLFQVQFKSRFTKTTSATLVLVSNNSSLNQCSVLVFSFVGTIQQMLPIKAFKIESPMYATPLATFQLNVTNLFDQKGNFKVSIRQSKKNTSKNDEWNGPLHESYNPIPFKLLQEHIELDPGQSGNVSLVYHAFEVFSLIH